MVNERKTIVLVVVFTLMCVLSNDMPYVMAQQPSVNNQSSSMNATNTSATTQGDTTVTNTTIDQAFDSLRDTFGSLFKK
jgi:predicted metalloprotease